MKVNFATGLLKYLKFDYDIKVIKKNLSKNDP